MKFQYLPYTVVVFAVAIIGVLVVVLRPRPIMPATVRKQYPASLLVPENASIKVQSNTAVYTPSDKLLTYNLTDNGIGMIVSEQPTPEQFIDFSDLYTKLVAGMSVYKTFESELGTVYLTTPKNIAGKQTAVMNAKGTLLFAKPQNNLSDDQWQLFFKSLTVEK